MTSTTEFDKFSKAIQSQMTQELAERLDKRFREEISAPKWDYPTPPQLRDIVDSGRLRDSQDYTVSPDGEITFTWSAPYAEQVHEGGVALTGQRFPGRPWTQEVLEDELPVMVKEIMERKIREANR